MNHTPDRPEPSSPTAAKRFSPRNWLLLIVTLVALAVVFALFLTPRSKEAGVVERTLTGPDAERITLNLAQTQDGEDPSVEIKEGYRYRVRVEDEAREGTAGIARIGGMVTFIDGLRPGDEAVVEVTRLKRSVAEAVVVKRLPAGEFVRPTATTSLSDEELASAQEHGPLVAGGLYKARIEETGRKGDGLARIDGMVVFVDGARLGDEVVFRVRKVSEKFASAVRVATLDQAAAAPSPAGPKALAPSADETVHDRGPVVVGNLYRATIDDTGRKGDGVAHIDGLVVFVAGATKGETVVMRVTEKTDRFARAEKVADAEAVPASAAAPAEGVAADEVVREHGPVAVGNLYRAIIDDTGRKGDGVAHIDGLVVFVEGAAKGEHVVMRVVEKTDRFARAKKVADAEALPVSASTSPAVTPSTLSPTASGSEPLEHKADKVQPGAVFDVTVAEQDRNNPEEDGVTRIDGLVVFIPGSQPDDRVRIRITKRKPRVAFSEVLEVLPTP